MGEGSQSRSPLHRTGCKQNAETRLGSVARFVTQTLWAQLMIVKIHASLGTVCSTSVILSKNRTILCG